jgi:SAM-dependent methyltransferase
LTFSEVSRALRALSSTYVERRHKIEEGGALSGAGKRAAFALFYAPLHFLLVRQVVAQLPGAAEPAPLVVDLGCGTGAAGAAWAPAGGRVVGVDRHPWALSEAAQTYRTFNLKGQTRQADAAAFPLPKEPASVVAAFTVNELPDASRGALLSRLLDRTRAPHPQVLIVEPLAKSATPWWRGWQEAFEGAGGRADEWRVRVELPPIVAKLDRAVGLNHREISGRTLWLPRSAGDPGSSS